MLFRSLYEGIASLQLRTSESQLGWIGPDEDQKAAAKRLIAQSRFCLGRKRPRVSNIFCVIRGPTTISPRHKETQKPKYAASVKAPSTTAARSALPADVCAA